MQPGKPIPFKRAIELGKRGRPRKGEEKGANSTLKKGSTPRAYILARLDRDGYSELAAQAHHSGDDQIFGAKQQVVRAGPCDYRGGCRCRMAHTSERRHSGVRG
jgi:hypothetical protein